MGGVAYTVFDTAVGRCALAWGAGGIVAVQLPDAREIETRRRLLRQCPEAREARPDGDIAAATTALTAFLRGETVDFSAIVIDQSGLPPFTRRVYDHVRLIPVGETRTYADIAARLGASGAVNTVTQAIARNPYPVIVPCHRVFETAGSASSGYPANGGLLSKSRLLTIESAPTSRAPTLMDVLFAVAPPRTQG